MRVLFLLRAPPPVIATFRAKYENPKTVLLKEAPRTRNSVKWHFTSFHRAVRYIRERMYAADLSDVEIALIRYPARPYFNVLCREDCFKIILLATKTTDHSRKMMPRVVDLLEIERQEAGQ